MLAGVYYGAQYGGAVASILMRLPGTPQSAVTTLDGYPMAREGRAGLALFAAMASSFAGSVLGIVVLVMLAGWLARAATAFGAAEYAAMMILGLVAASTIGTARPAKGFAMVALGLLLGCVGTDVNSGAQRFTFGQTELLDGINLVALAMGLFGVAEVIANVRDPDRQSVAERIGFRQPDAGARRSAPHGLARRCGAARSAASSAHCRAPAPPSRPSSTTRWSARSRGTPSASARAPSRASRGRRPRTTPPPSPPSSRP